MFDMMQVSCVTFVKHVKLYIVLYNNYIIMTDRYFVLFNSLQY